MFAAENGHSDLAKMLLAHPDIDVNLQWKVQKVFYTQCAY